MRLTDLNGDDEMDIVGNKINVGDTIALYSSSCLRVMKVETEIGCYWIREDGRRFERSISWQPQRDTLNLTALGLDKGNLWDKSE